MSVLSLKDVSYKYGKTEKYVLKNINATFEKGKMYSIVGKSGSGKSTLLSLISGLDVCTDGDIYYEQTSLNKLNRDDYRSKRIGVIFQSYNLLMNSTAVQNIILSMHISNTKMKNKKEFAYNLLEKVGINRESADRKTIKLSGGEQQRVGIARALSNNASVIIADEPTGNLDEATENSILEILSYLSKNEGKCIIIVTHSKKVASIADEKLSMKEGRLM